MVAKIILLREFCSFSNHLEFPLPGTGLVYRCVQFELDHTLQPRVESSMTKTSCFPFATSCIKIIQMPSNTSFSTVPGNNNIIRRFLQFIFTVYYVAIGCLFWINPAYAYIDPGLGSIVFQGILAGLITILAFWRNVNLKIRKFFSSQHEENDNVAEDANNNDTE